MMRYGYSRLIGSIFISALLGASVSSCSEQEEADVSLLSDTEIILSLPEWTPVAQSRAVLFDSRDDLMNKEKGGGNFTLYAYMDATGKAYIDDVRTWYFSDFSEWVMLDRNQMPRKYYWPNTDKLNFFAFMPDGRYNGSDGYKSDNTYVTILSYSRDKGQQFECNLPSAAGDKVEKTQEFIYAYEAGKTKLDTEPDKTFKLKFKHPFAMVNFKLKGGSYRMTIKDFKFEKIYLNGIFSTVPHEWEPTGDPEVFTAEINKRIPNDVNYYSKLYLAEWFVVMPQELNNVKLTMSAERDPDPTTEKGTPITGTFAFGPEAKWEPGFKYTYLISYGNNKEEIYFNVEVEKEWIEGYEQNIDVE